MAEKSAGNLLDAIKESKQIKRSRASSTRWESATSAKRRRAILARHFGALEALIEADEEQLRLMTSVRWSRCVCVNSLLSRTIVR